MKVKRVPLGETFWNVRTVGVVRETKETLSLPSVVCTAIPLEIAWSCGASVSFLLGHGTRFKRSEGARNKLIVVLGYMGDPFRVAEQSKVHIRPLST